MNKITDISTILMRSTFKIFDNNSIGTSFILGKPDPENKNKGSYILITATHVLEGLKSDVVTIDLRKEKDGNFYKLPVQIKIRNSGKPLWIPHSEVDISVMPIPLPKDADILLTSTELLATDKMLEEFEIHPGDEMNILGFPYGFESNKSGFPILRSGRISSYPLIPTIKTKKFLLDFEVFGGNSGGPVFMHCENRFYGDGTHLGAIRLIAGVVTQESQIEEKVNSMNETVIKRHKLALAEVVHASFVKELIDAL